jgi:hypothetical protein
MKFKLFLTIFLILTNHIFSQDNLDFDMSDHTVQNDSNAHESIYEIIRSTNGNIFAHMRNVKQDFPPDIQHLFEKTIKNYEYRYLSDKEDFISFMYDKYQEMKYFEKNERKAVEDKYKDETLGFLKEIVKIYNKCDDKEKKVFDEFVEKQDKFTRDLLELAIKHHIIFDDSKFKDLETIVHTIPEMLFTNQNLDKLKDIKGKINLNGEEIKPKKKSKENNNKIKSMEKLKNNIISREINNSSNNSTNSNNTLNENDENLKKRKKEFNFKQNYTKINKNFTKFINNITDEYNLTHLHSDQHPGELKKLIFDNISNSMKQNHKRSFSVLLQEYITEALYDNDMSLVSQINSFAKDDDDDDVGFDIPRFKSKETQEDPPKPSTDTMKGATSLGAKITARNVAKSRVQDILRKKKIDQFGKGQTCDNKEQQVKDLIAAKAEEIKEKQKQLKLDFPEIPKDILNIGLDMDGIAGILKMIIMKFIGKLAVLIISQIPFYFFKFCIPPGPLVWGCCPEASFFPTQVYNLFTIFDKVEKFRMTARSYPSWLSSIDRDWFSEPLYYICAQGYLTMHESGLFEMCNPITLMYMNFLNLMGLLPGDFPPCFITCIQV